MVEALSMEIFVVELVPVDPVKIGQNEEPREREPRIKEWIGDPVVVTEVRRWWRIVRHDRRLTAVVVVVDSRRRLTIGRFTRRRRFANRRCSLGIGLSPRWVHR